jgi:hypothetical protein
MATKKQLDANRRNAKLSTGPTTAAGLARSSKNALKHGLTAKEMTCDPEEEKKFAAFRDDIIAALDPSGPLEEELAEEYAYFSWRLRRVPRLELMEIEHHQETALGVKVLRKSMLELISEGACQPLTRYEASLHRMRQRVLHTLERLQARRRGEAVAVPVAMDITHSLRSERGPIGPRARKYEYSNDHLLAPIPPMAE